MNKISQITQRLDFPLLLKEAENDVKFISKITDENGDAYDASSDVIRLVVYSVKGDETQVTIPSTSITKSYDASTGETSFVLNIGTLTQEVRNQSVYELQNTTKKVMLAYGSFFVRDSFGF